MTQYILLITFLTLCVTTGKIVAADWWENGNFYQIYPRSFQDSDGDGIGDLNGITSRLDYIKYLGVTAIWLSPIFQSPMKDFGYDISDYKQIHKEFGTMEDFDRLVQRCNELDIKLILDFVPNHTSDEHDWFVKSKEGTDETYKEYYVWHPGTKLENGTMVPPNNWISIFRYSAWTWVESRQAYYLHQFLEQQPDLNYRNPNVVQEMKDILSFWLNKGVAGFRCDAVPYLFEVEPDANKVYPDEPLSGACTDPQSYCYLKHIYTSDVEETFDMIYQWRIVMDSHEDAPTRILMTEAYTSLPNTLRFYGKTENGHITANGSQIPFNFELISYTNSLSTGLNFLTNIKNWLNGMPNGAGVHANWVLGNHDNKRLASRYRPERTDLFNILLKTLPGIAVTYNGEELGLTDVYISWKDTQDPQACRTDEKVYDQFSRDPARTPFQWDDTQNAGFSNASKTWLPVAQNYTKNNVKLQMEQPFSHLKVFRKLLLLRKNPTFESGDLEIKADKDLIVYKRELKDDLSADIFVIVLNLGRTPKHVTLKQIFPILPNKLEVVVTSIQATTYITGDIVDSAKIIAQPEVGTVFVGVKNS